MGALFRYRAFDPDTKQFVEWTSDTPDPGGLKYSGETPFDKLESVVLVRKLFPQEDEITDRKLLDLLDEDLDDGEVWTLEYEETPNIYIKINGYIQDQCICPSTPVPMSAFKRGEWSVLDGKDERGAMSFEAGDYPVIDNAKLDTKTSWSIPELDLTAPGNWTMMFDLEVLSEENRVDLHDLFGFGVYGVGFNQKGEVKVQLAREGRRLLHGIHDDEEGYILISDPVGGPPEPGQYVGSLGCSSLPNGYLDAMVMASTSFGPKKSETRLLYAWGGSAPYPKGMGDWSASAVAPMMRFVMMVNSARECGVHFKLRPRVLKWSPLVLEHF